MNVINRYSSGTISDQELEEWALLVEFGEEVDYEEGYEVQISEAIFKLANPILEGREIPEICKEIILSGSLE